MRPFLNIIFFVCAENNHNCCFRNRIKFPSKERMRTEKRTHTHTRPIQSKNIIMRAFVYHNMWMHNHFSEYMQNNCIVCTFKKNKMHAIHSVSRIILYFLIFFPILLSRTTNRPALQVHGYVHKCRTNTKVWLCMRVMVEKCNMYHEQDVQRMYEYFHTRNAHFQILEKNKKN